jgi:ribose 1,5-bisphosphokinase PhnN
MFGVKWVVHRHETHPVEVENSGYQDVDKVVESCRARLPEMRRKHPQHTPRRLPSI